MKSNIIYLKVEQSVKVNKKEVVLKDVAALFCSDTKTLKEVEKIKIYQVESEVKKETKFIFSLIYVIELIKKRLPNYEIVNIGSTEFVVCYVPYKTPNKVLDLSKVIIVCFLIFFGSILTIMTFNEDASLKEIFKLLYGLFDSDKQQDLHVLEIAYSIGIPIGTIVFFNHFSRFKMDDDPTPIQMQMRLYEGDEMTTIIENASREENMIENTEDLKSNGNKSVNQNK